MPDMPADTDSRSKLHATVESLRYWVPTIADVARARESDTDDAWTLAIEPAVAGACPVELRLCDGHRFDLAIAGEVYAGRTADSLELMLPLLEAITAGRVVQRLWISRATGACRAVESIVTLADGSSWRDGRTTDGLADAVPRDETERHDRHFLPYRR